MKPIKKLNVKEQCFYYWSSSCSYSKMRRKTNIYWEWLTGEYNVQVQGYIEKE
jgi:hypothetical protein